jgi:hypothetical protein
MYKRLHYSESSLSLSELNFNNSSLILMSYSFKSQSETSF